MTNDRRAAEEHAASCERVVIVEFLDGPEVSLLVITDGTTAVPLLPAQDHKRLRDFDEGPNTGGMGAYAPLPWLPEGTVEEVMTTVARPTLAAMAERGTPFAGVLYIGLALTAKGPKVVEFNARFGDPEAEVVLPLLETGLGGLLLAAATGRLGEYPPLRWRDGFAVCVVISAAGYPEAPRSGDPIRGVEGPGYYHAGTALDPEGTLVSQGGRVVCCSATAATLDGARAAAYELVGRVELMDSHYRTDIATKA